MSINFRRILNLGKFVRFTVTKGGITPSFGIPGARISASPKRGVHANLGIPGTGIYMRQKLSGNSKSKKLDSVITEERKAAREYERKKEMELYDKQLEDPRWKELSKLIKERDGFKCVVCGSTKNLQCHHKRKIVKNGVRLEPWKYKSEDLITLCRDCHYKGQYQYKFKIPVIKL